MKGTNLAMNDHSGALVLQPLHCWVWCNTWNDYGCGYAELTGRISCCHPSISSCWVQTCQRLKQSNARTEAKAVLKLIYFWSAESSPEQQTNRSHPRSAHYKEKIKETLQPVQTGAVTLQLLHTSPPSKKKTSHIIPERGRELLTVLQRCPMPLILKDPVG